MAEAATTNEITTVVSPANTPTESAYELNEIHDIDFLAQSPRGKVKVRHILRKPTLGELTAREQATPYRSRDVGADSEEIMVDASGRADASLYDKIVIAAHGYGPDVFKFEGATEAERSELLKRIPAAHKSAAIREIYSLNSKSEDTGEEAEFFIWGEGLTYRITQEIGSGEVPSFTLTHVMREPSERQIQEYRNRSTRYLIEKGAKKPVTKILTNLGAAVEFYDSLVENVEGVVFDGGAFDATNSTHLSAIDPVFKRDVVDTLLRITQVEMGN